MGVSCSKTSDRTVPPSPAAPPDGLLDPFMHQLEQRSIEYVTGERPSQQGQNHLLHKHQRVRSSNSGSASSAHSGTDNKQPLEQQPLHHPTRLVVRRRTVRACEEGMSGTHIYAVRYPADQPLKRELLPPQQASEQAPPRPLTRSEARPRRTPFGTHDSSSYLVQQPQAPPPSKVLAAKNSLDADKGDNNDKKETPTPTLDHLFARETMLAPPKQKIKDWVTVNEEHKIYIADVGLSPAQCDTLVQITESVCRGQYAAYTYAKQTLGCREFPALAVACKEAVHTMVHAITEFSGNVKLLLDDREPHMVKYDDTKRERQKLDMHTDKSEWTFLISLSDGSGLDYDGGGTYFECLDATVHIQRGHALVFPGKLRHCGQRITKGLRFLLVGFLVDKGIVPLIPAQPASNTSSAATSGGGVVGNNGGSFGAGSKLHFSDAPSTKLTA